MSDVFRAGKPALTGRILPPVPVTIAAWAIIMTRCLGVLLLVNELCLEAIGDFVHRSAQAWDSTLIFIASQLIFFIELRCALTMLRGSRRGRGLWLMVQGIVLLYMWVASMGWIYPEIFSVSGDSNGQIIHHLLMQKMPDLLLALLLFMPTTSRQFFRHNPQAMKG